MGRILYAVGAWCARRRYSVLVGWLAILGTLVGLGVMFAGSFESSSSIPGSPAQTALTTMDKHFPDPDRESADIVVQTRPGHKITDPAVRAALQHSLASTAKVDGVASVDNPLTDGSVSPDGRTAVVSVDFTTPKDDDVPVAALDGVRHAGQTLRDAGVRTVYGGDAYAPSSSAFGPTEMIGLGVALLILIVTFGSLLAAGLPLLTALLGVVGTVTGLLSAAALFGISDNATTLASMLGLAVGIDYALFIVSRHRRQLAEGTPIHESIARATATAGSAVVFAGATVIIALAGLTVAGVPMLSSMGLATGGAVFLAVLMALTLLPALLGVVGQRAVPKCNSRAARRDASEQVRTMGARWVALVTRHSVRSLVGGLLLIGVIAVPALQLKQALPDAGSDPSSASTRQAYDLTATAFGKGANGPLVVLVENSDPAKIAPTTAAVQQRLTAVSGIAHVSGVDVADDHQAGRIQVIPTTGPGDPATSHLVTELRAVTADVSRSTGSYVAVTGQTAVSIDVTAKLSTALLPFALVVIGLSLLLLMLAFRSVTIPLKATLGYLLSLAASFGATVAVFQWGWFDNLLGITSHGPVSTFAPIIIMAVLFGLAMDYEVFMVSGMKEHYGKDHDPDAAIASGARGATRVVTAAALIMISVFVGFLLGGDPSVMAIAFGLAVGVLVDAFLIRMTMVPAAMTLLGHHAWSLPGWLDRILPHLDVEGESVTGHSHETQPPAQDKTLVGAGTPR